MSVDAYITQKYMSRIREVMCVGDIEFHISVTSQRDNSQDCFTLTDTDIDNIVVTLNYTTAMARYLPVT